jgi:anaerobic dimethyl sulfoxide reductase subunit C (anchor subunit)
MNTRELALITFTIFGQMAAGAMLVLMVVRAYLATKAKTEEVNDMLNGPLFIVVPLMGVALLASLLHLNNPVNVLRASPNLGSSWLSREVVLGLVFVVLAAVYTFMQWRKLGDNGLRTIIGWIAAVAGMVLTYAMSRVYMIRTQPAWNTVATPVSFLVTALLLGGLAVAAAMIVTNNRAEKQSAEKRLPLLRQVLQSIALGAVILLGIEFVVLPVYMGYLATQGSAALESLHLMVGPYFGALVLRLLLIFAGAGILGTYLYRNAGLPGREKAMAGLTYGALALVLVGEVMGRILFYATHVRIGL